MAAFSTVPESFSRGNDSQATASERSRWTTLSSLVALMVLVLVLSASTVMGDIE